MLNFDFICLIWWRHACSKAYPLHEFLAALESMFDQKLASWPLFFATNLRWNSENKSVSW